MDPMRPYGFFVEEERSATGEVVAVATVLLTNRECPWKCVMCDLWRNTLPVIVPIGAIPAQIDLALSQLPPARQIKLYNSGSFFDPRAIPVEDYPLIAERLRSFERVIVESHPALVGPATLRLRDLLTGKLEVAMGLETAHPEVLERLNKRMTLDDYSRAAEFLRVHGIDLRAFILVQPPFMEPDEALCWAERSLDFAFDCGASICTLIPTRANNGAMETLTASGEFQLPDLDTVEAALDYGISLGRGRVFVDLWDLASHTACTTCFKARLSRLHTMNLSQALLGRSSCTTCG